VKACGGSGYKLQPIFTFSCLKYIRYEKIIVIVRKSIQGFLTDCIGFELPGMKSVLCLWGGGGFCQSAYTSQVGAHGI
jgi:hypothetical protein